eukprot:TRINITY_DN6137_c0_g1_i1.p1 TRINITY_DN6137_c0_g1~~TRINITY_DN6137_c0_g1_i1.p1  ORF type:complete len:1368 (+),score=137.61 TRINITY_DN6137_c0_g1_i1:65-4168(+)
MAATPAQLKLWKSSLRSPSPKRSESPLGSPAVGSPPDAQGRPSSPGRKTSFRRADSGQAKQGGIRRPSLLSSPGRPRSVSLSPCGPPADDVSDEDGPPARSGSFRGGSVWRRQSVVPPPPVSSAARRSYTSPVFAPPSVRKETPRFMKTTRSLEAPKYVDGSGFQSRDDYHDVVRWPDRPRRAGSAGSFRSPSPTQSPKGRSGVAFGNWDHASLGDSADMACMALEAYGWETEEYLTFEEFLTMLDDIEPDSGITGWFTRDVFSLCLRSRGADPVKGMGHSVLTDIFNEWFYHDTKVMSRLQRHLESRSQDSKSIRSLKSSEGDAPGYMKPTKSFIQSSQKLITAEDAKNERRKKRLARLAERERRRNAVRSSGGRRKRAIRSPRRHEDDWRIGDTVLVRDQEGEPWKSGVVKGFADGRPLVQPKGFTKAHHWKVVHKPAAKEDCKERRAGIEGATKALLIGIDYLQDTPGVKPPQDAELIGCTSDMKRVARMMHRRGLGFKQKVLTDDIDKCLPTRHNITEGLHWLVEGSQAGDCLLLVYSGHSGYRLPCDPRRDTTPANAIIPADYVQRGVITGSETLSILSRLHPGARLTVVADCPRGGGIMDLPFQLSAERDGRFGLSEAAKEDSLQIYQIDCQRGEPKRTRLAVVSETDADALEGGLETGLISAWIHATETVADPMLMPMLSEIRGLMKEKLGGHYPLPCVSSTRRVDLGDKFTLGFTEKRAATAEASPAASPPASPGGPALRVDGPKGLTADSLRLAARQAALQQAKGNKTQRKPAFNWKGMFGWLPPPYSTRDAMPVHRRAPDYGDPAAWVCNFALGVGQTVQRWFPQSSVSSPHRHRPDPVPREADCFFVHPTTVEVGWGESDWDDHPTLTQQVVKTMASTFNGCCRIYAPKYRQARFQAYSCPARGEFSTQVQFDIAYSDVKRAFEHYLEKHNPLGPSGRRPIILAGHGQGSQHLARLLQESPPERSLVCAYLIGWHVGDDTLAHRLPLGRLPHQTRCWVTFSLADPGEEKPSAFGVRGRPPLAAGSPAAQCTSCPLAVNPLSWKAEPKLTDPQRHLGALLQDGTLGDHSVFGARIHITEQGVPEVKLRVAKPEAWSESIGLTGAQLRDRRRSWQSLKLSDLHELEYNLFWLNIRENAEARVRVWAPPFLRHVLEGGGFMIQPSHMSDTVLGVPERPRGGCELAGQQKSARGGKPPHHRWRFVQVQVDDSEDEVWGHIECVADEKLVLDAGARNAQKAGVTSPSQAQSGSATAECSPARARSATPSSTAAGGPSSPRRGANVCVWPRMRGKAAGRTEAQLWKIARIDAGLRLVEIVSRNGRLLTCTSPAGSDVLQATTMRRATGADVFRQRFVVCVAR